MLDQEHKGLKKKMALPFFFYWKHVTLQHNSHFSRTQDKNIVQKKNNKPEEKKRIDRHITSTNRKRKEPGLVAERKQEKKIRLYTHESNYPISLTKFIPQNLWHSNMSLVNEGHGNTSILFAKWESVWGSPTCMLAVLFITYIFV